MTKPVYALHQIHHNPTGKKVEIITPGTVFVPLDADYDHFMSVEAVRQPKEGELAIFEQQEARRAKAAEAAEPKLTAAEKKAAAAAAAEAEKKAGEGDAGKTDDKDPVG